MKSTKHDIYKKQHLTEAVSPKIVRKRLRWFAIAISAVASLFVAIAAFGLTPASGGLAGGTTITINNGPGDQTDPHVNGNLAVYTDSNGSSQIRYYDFVTTNDNPVPAGTFTWNEQRTSPQTQVALSASGESAKLIGSNPSAHGFGSSVAISGNTAIVGSTSNKAFVFVRTGSGWAEQQELSALDGGGDFGLSVAIDGDTAIIGAPGNSGKGAAYVFVRTGSFWTQQQKLIASDGAFGDGLGLSVGISADTVIAGAFSHHNTTPVPSDGAAYVFFRSGTTWTQQAELIASDEASGDAFGSSVAIDGNTAIAGAPLKNRFSPPNKEGAAYFFVRSAGVWTEQQKLTASDGAPADQFGRSVAISGNTAVVGATGKTIGGNQAQGAAYVFELGGSGSSRLTASDGGAGGQFGYSVAVSNGKAIIGMFDVLQNAAGAAYVFVNPGTWVLQSKLTASDGAANDSFGYSVALSAGTTIIGAALDDIGSEINQGSAYVFVDTPTQQKIAFQSFRDGNREIYLMNPDGSNQTRLTNNPATDQEPCISPDGSKIVFDSDRNGTYQIYAMNSDGSNPINLSNNSSDLALAPSFSPDGTKIVFVSFRNGPGQIYVMDASGTNQVNLSNTSFTELDPWFSPDGNKIAFRSTRDGNAQIYVMDADGSNQTRLTNNSADDYEPAYSPDGSKIAFATTRDGNFEIYVMNADGINPINLSNNPAAERHPTFSPDGSKIAFVSNRDGNNEIYVMDADGSNQIRLTNNPASDFYPSWGFVTTAPGNTPTGTNVSVSPAPGVTVTFSQVTVAGNTSVTIGGPPPPSGFQVDGLVYDISTTATVMAPITVCLPYSPSNPTPMLSHYENVPPPMWVNLRPSSIDTVNHIVCGVVSSLSPFAVLTPTPGADLSITKTGLPDPATVGGALVYTLNISNAGPTTATNIGITDTLPASVTFNSATASQGACTQSGGTVTCDLGSLANGNSAMVAINVRPNAAGNISNTATVSASESDPNTLNNTATITTTVNKAATNTTVSSSQNPSVAGQSVTFTASVTSSAGQPTGTVQFYADGSPLGSAQTLSNGTATISTSSLSVGTHSITASYSGDGNFNSSTSAALTQTLSKANTSTSITSDSPDPSVVGQAYAVNFTVAAVSPGTGTPSGTVTVSDGTGSTCSATLGGGSGSCSLTSITAGPRTLTATYGADSRFNGISGTAAHQVNKANISTSLLSSQNPSNSGQSVTFTANVTVGPPGAGTPTGTVAFRDGAALLSTVALNASGQAPYTTSSLALGPHSITATYNGDTNFNGSASASLLQTVSNNLQIVFESLRNGNPDIYSMNADGTNQTRLTTNGAADANPAWSPDHSKIAFTSTRDGNLEIYVMNADGSNQTLLTNNAALDDDPSWSPDGTRIAFWSSRNGNPEIYVMNANGTNQTRLTNNSALDIQPEWSPDGSKIVFTSNRDGLFNTEIYVMNANGSGVTRLTRDRALDGSPDWSPDGTKIVFASNRMGLLDFEIWVMNADGANPVRLTTAPRASVGPSWAPNGSQIVFATNRDNLVSFEIYSMNANGSNPRRLTSNTIQDFAPNW